MNPHHHRVAAAVEDSAATFTTRTWTALSHIAPDGQLPPAIIKRHQKISSTYPDAYTPLRIYGYCMIIAARSTGSCQGRSLAYIVASIAAKPRYAQQLSEATTSQSAATIGARIIKRRGHGLCLARLWLDLTGLDADRIPLGSSGRTIADRIRHQWHIDIHRNQS